MDMHVYALRSWTIKKRGDEYFIAVTGSVRKHKWRGPYGTLQRAAHAIARKLQWEFTRRHARAAIMSSLADPEKTTGCSP